MRRTRSGGERRWVDDALRTLQDVVGDVGRAVVDCVVNVSKGVMGVVEAVDRAAYRVGRLLNGAPGTLKRGWKVVAGLGSGASGAVVALTNAFGVDAQGVWSTAVGSGLTLPLVIGCLGILRRSARSEGLLDTTTGDDEELAQRLRIEERVREELRPHGRRLSPPLEKRSFVVDEMKVTRDACARPPVESSVTLVLVREVKKGRYRVVARDGPLEHELDVGTTWEAVELFSYPQPFVSVLEPFGYEHVYAQFAVATDHYFLLGLSLVPPCAAVALAVGELATRLVRRSIDPGDAYASGGM